MIYCNRVLLWQAIAPRGQIKYKEEAGKCHMLRTNKSEEVTKTTQFLEAFFMKKYHYNATRLQVASSNQIDKITYHFPIPPAWYSMTHIILKTNREAYSSILSALYLHQVLTIGYLSIRANIKWTHLCYSCISVSTKVFTSKKLKNEIGILHIHTLVCMWSTPVKLTYPFEVAM